jgi:hypothetical protein
MTMRVTKGRAMKRSSLLALVGVLATMVPGAAVAASAAAGTTSATVAIVHRPVQGGYASNDTFLSTNWSGYAVSATSAFTNVVGSWVQPAATCSRRSTTYASFWVGIDGYSSGSVEQLGTDSDCSRGTPRYYAWYEMYPAASVTLPYAVQAGDTLSGGVARSGGSYTLSLTDTRNGVPQWSFSQPESGSNANSSAEWVAEAPELCNIFFCQLASLTNFGAVNFTGAQAAVGGPNAPISSFTASGGPHEIVMVNNSGTTKAQPTGLDATGTQFGDAWKHS